MKTFLGDKSPKEREALFRAAVDQLEGEGEETADLGAEGEEAAVPDSEEPVPDEPRYRPLEEVGEGFILTVIWRHCQK